MAPKEDTYKVQLDYPCKWLYKVIGMDREQLHRAIMDTISSKPSKISISNTSSSGKYICLDLEITVENEDDRNAIYLDLKAHPHVKIVL